MKQNLFTLVVFIALALAVILLIKSKNRLRRTGSAPALTTIVTQQGALRVMQPQPAAEPVIIATLPKTNGLVRRNSR